MRQFTKMHFIESTVWVSLVILLFAFSFEFDKEIEEQTLMELMVYGKVYDQTSYDDAAATGPEVDYTTQS